MLALFMISVSFILWPPLEMAPARPDALRLIAEPPRSLLLFGWFLLPYSLLKSRWIFVPAALALVIASSVLSMSIANIFSFYHARDLPPGDSILFRIGLSLITCAMQPVAVIARRIGNSLVAPAAKSTQ